MLSCIIQVIVSITVDTAQQNIACTQRKTVGKNKIQGARYESIQFQIYHTSRESASLAS